MDVAVLEGFVFQHFIQIGRRIGVDQKHAFARLDEFQDCVAGQRRFADVARCGHR